MKTHRSLVVLFCLCWGNVVFGGDAEVVYVDSGLASYCFSPGEKDAAVELYIRDIASEEVRKHCLPGTLYPAKRRESASYVARFPLAWSLNNKMLRILFPNLHIDAIGRVSFLIWETKDISVPDINPYGTSPNDFHPSKAYTAQDGVTIYNEWHGRGSHFQALSSKPFAFAQSKKNPKIAWYDLDGTHVIARLPFAYTESLAWEPCTTPLFFQWIESRFSVELDGFIQADTVRDEKITHSEDFPPDGFSPVGSVRIAGKRVLSDDPKATFPKDADWLIWEKDGDAYRLCQMREGRWSVCKDVPRKDAPKTIVINNDSNTVFLLYSMGIDAEDVDGSLKKLVAFLRARGELQ